MMRRLNPYHAAQLWPVLGLILLSAGVELTLTVRQAYNTLTVTRTNLQAVQGAQAWPFHFGAGQLRCVRPDNLLITDIAARTTYVFRGTDAWNPEERGWRPYQEALAVDFSQEGQRHVQPFADKAATLCLCSWLEHRPRCPNVQASHQPSATHFFQVLAPLGSSKDELRPT